MLNIISNAKLKYSVISMIRGVRYFESSGYNKLHVHFQQSSDNVKMVGWGGGGEGRSKYQGGVNSKYSFVLPTLIFSTLTQLTQASDLMLV